MVSIKKSSNYATCSSNSWVKLRWQPKLPMALNGLNTLTEDEFRIFISRLSHFVITAGKKNL